MHQWPHCGACEAAPVFHKSLLQRWVPFSTCCHCGGSENRSDIQGMEMLDLFSPDEPQIILPDAHETSFAPVSCQSKALTIRQKEFRDRIELPQMCDYPHAPGYRVDEPEDTKRYRLLQFYQEFTFDLYVGMHLTQLINGRFYEDVHCQLMDDLQTLKLDQSDGCIIEFPLISVSSVFPCDDGDWNEIRTSLSKSTNRRILRPEFPVEVDFSRRRLTFIFNVLMAAQQFALCIQLLARWAQQRAGKNKFSADCSAMSRTTQLRGCRRKDRSRAPDRSASAMCLAPAPLPSTPPSTPPVPPPPPPPPKEPSQPPQPRPQSSSAKVVRPRRAQWTL